MIIIVILIVIMVGLSVLNARLYMLLFSFLIFILLDFRKASSISNFMCEYPLRLILPKLNLLYFNFSLSFEAMNFLLLNNGEQDYLHLQEV